MKRIKEHRGELIFLGVVLCYVGYYAYSIRDYAFRAAAWPNVLMVLLVFLSLAVIVTMFLPAGKSSGEEADGDAGTKGKPALIDRLRANAPTLYIIAALLLYAALLKILGFILCTVLLVFGMTFFLSGKKIVVSVIMAAVVSVSFYVVFGVIIGARLPSFSLF